MHLKLIRTDKSDAEIRSTINIAVELLNNNQIIDADNKAVSIWNTHFFKNDMYVSDIDILSTLSLIFKDIENIKNGQILDSLIDDINTQNSQSSFNNKPEIVFDNLPKLKSLLEEPGNRIADVKNGVLVKPGIDFTKIRVENTNSCKYSCEMCPREKMTRSTGIMPPEDYNLFLYRLKEYVEETNLPQPFDGKFFLHGYGEPLFDQKLAEKSAMVDEQFPAAESYIFSTLGVKRSKTYFEKLLMQGKLKNVEISLYGFQEHTYSAIHTGGNFHTVKENLINLALINKSLGNPCKITICLLSPWTEDIINCSPIGRDHH